MSLSLKTAWWCKQRESARHAATKAFESRGNPGVQGRGEVRRSALSGRRKQARICLPIGHGRPGGRARSRRRAPRRPSPRPSPPRFRGVARSGAGATHLVAPCAARGDASLSAWPSSSSSKPDVSRCLTTRSTRSCFASRCMLPEEPAEQVAAGGDVGVIRAERLLRDRQGAPE
jgi:hypothetical protein